MVQQRRPVAERRPPLAGLDPHSPAQSLARATDPAPPQSRRRRAPAPALAPSAVDAPTAGAEMQLGVGTILVSLPAAFTFGQMLIDRSLDTLPQVAGWAAVVVVYQVATRPGNVRGLLDWVGGQTPLGPEMRRRLGIPDELPVVAPRPRSRGVLGFLDGLSADVANVRAAQAARRGEFEEGEFTLEDGPAQPDARRAPAVAAPARSGGQAGQDVEPVDYEAGGADNGWLAEVNDQPDRNPHLAVVGPSGSGKSTLVLAALTARPGALVICTIKSKEDDPWGGFPAIRLSFDASNEPSVKKIGAAIRAFYKEMNARHADGTRPRTPATLVIDELTSILAELGDEYIKMLIRMWISGRSVGMRTIVMDPTFNVKGWGLEGRGDVRESILGIRCERDRSAHFFEWDATRNRPFNQRPIDTGGVLALSARGLPASRAWRPTPAGAAPTQPPPAPADQALAGLVTCDACGQPTPRAGRHCILCGAAQHSAGDQTAPLAAAPERQRQALAADRARPESVSVRVPPPAPQDDLFAALLAGVAPQPAPASYEPDLSQLRPEIAAKLQAIQARQRAAAPASEPAAKAEPATQPASSEAPPETPVRQSMTVSDDGRTLVINNEIHVDRAKALRKKGVNTKRMRSRADKYKQVRALVAEGKSGNEVDRILPGDRSSKLRLVRQAKKELGIEEKGR